MTAAAPSSTGWKARLGRARQCWIDFWFRPEDTFTLGLMRLLTGAMLTYNLLVWGLDLQTFFGSNGVQPLDVIRDFHGGRSVSFLFYVPDEWLPTVHWSCVVVAAMFCLGIGTRVTSVLAWMITISYSQRVPVANFGLDQILGLLCMYLAIGPSGDSLSIDAWFRHRHVPLLPRPPKASARMTLRLIQIHVCVIYFWAGFAKLKGDSWWTGEALWQVIANQEYQTLDLTWMASVPWLPYLIAHVTVAWEVFFCVLIWVPALRPLMLLMGTLMHVGIGAFLGMWTFGLIMTFAYFSYSDPVRWRHRLQWLTGRTATAAGARRTATEAASQSAAISLTAAVSVPAADPLAGDDADRRDPECADPECADQERRKARRAASEPECAPALTARKTSVLIVSADAAERQSLRRYLREHEIPCRATMNAELALHAVHREVPGVILLSGTQLTATGVARMLGDLADGTDAPQVVMVTQRQQDKLTAIVDQTTAQIAFLRYPVSLREIREQLVATMLEQPLPHSREVPTPSAEESATS